MFSICSEPTHFTSLLLLPPWPKPPSPPTWLLVAASKSVSQLTPSFYPHSLQPILNTTAEPSHGFPTHSKRQTYCHELWVWGFSGFIIPPSAHYAYTFLPSSLGSTMASSLLFKYLRQTPSYLYWLFPSPKTLFSKISACLILSLLFGFDSNVSFPKATPLILSRR